MLSKPEPIIQIRDLSLGYDTEKGVVIAVDDLSLDIPRGKISALVGESGCGKSTIANAMIGFIKYPNVKLSGSIKFENSDILSLNPIALRKMRMNKIAIVPQAAMNSLNPVLRIGSEIHDIMAANATVSRAEERRIIEAALAMVELPDYVLNSYSNQISGGMKQRVMIAIASMLGPDVMILDEPTTGLDVIVQKNILDIIRKINEKKGTTIILITHDIPVAFYLADYTTILYSGKAVEDGKKEDVSHSRLHPYTKLLIGSVPSMSGERRRLTTIPGEVHPMMEAQRSCAFSPRCPFAIEECSSVELKDFEVAEESVRCFRYDPSMKTKFVSETGIENSSIDSGLSDDFITKFERKEKHSIEIIDLTKKFTVGRGTKRQIVLALDGVSLSVETGKIVSLVGASGSGKTTVGKIILFDEKPTAGKYIFDGKDVSRAREREIKKLRKTVQMIFQDPFSSLSPIHKIGYQVERPLLINKICTKENVRENVLGMLNLVGLRPAEDFIEKFPYELSGGQRQRVSIAKALAVGAKILVADEPVSMLDASVRAEILNLLTDLKDKLDLGILYITHDLSTVRYIADHIYVMNAGKIEEEGLLEKVISNPSREYTKKLLESVV